MVLKVIEVLGTSEKGWEDAAREALSQAARSIKHIRCIDVVKHTAKVEDGKIVSYTADCKICFEVHAEEHLHQEMKKAK
ncbi:MAG TPA: dodecin family protein [Planctomycetota bacterium]|nr:dodecin family protein [Planctomycetota bacterium]